MKNSKIRKSINSKKHFSFYKAMLEILLNSIQVHPFVTQKIFTES